MNQSKKLAYLHSRGHDRFIEGSSISDITNFYESEELYTKENTKLLNLLYKFATIGDTLMIIKNISNMSLMHNSIPINELRTRKITQHIDTKEKILNLLDDVGYIVCCDCGSVSEKDRATNNNDEGHLCEGCFDDSYCTCGDCGDVMLLDDSNYMENEGTYCNNCFPQHGFTCADCNELTAHNDGYELRNGDSICRSCFESNDYIICEDCGYAIPYDDYESDEEYYYCTECWNHREGIEHTRKNTIELKDCKHSKNLRHKIHTSLEIESEYPGQRSKDDVVRELVLQHKANVDFVGDGSLNNGIECKISALYGKDLIDTTKSVCANLVDNGFAIKQTCGLHIHLNALDKTEEELKRFVKFYMIFEHLIFAMLPPSRQDNRYCMRMVKDFKLEDFDLYHQLDYAYYKSERGLNSRKSDKYDSARYYALNVHSWFYRGTLEFRMHNGSLNASKILMFVKILHELYALGFSLSEKRIAELETYNDNAIKSYWYRYILKTKKVKTYYTSRVTLFSYANSIRPTRTQPLQVKASVESEAN